MEEKTKYTSLGVETLKEIAANQQVIDEMRRLWIGTGRNIDKFVEIMEAKRAAYGRSLLTKKKK